jgi:hypothetical protein
MRILSVRWNVETEAISLITDRRTMFAMTILILSLRSPNKIFPRSLNVSLPRATLVAWWKQSHRPRLARSSCLRTLSLRDVQKARRGNLLTSRSPHCVRDDNLYYTRNDKSQDGHTAQDTSHELLFSGFAKNFSMEGTRLGVAKAARSPPNLPFLGRRFFNLILYEL